ncbi:GNAT family N-acetyltransferase [Hypericibacter sp.]|uniref:GNAT family N-acetyltransferase n=1 Tax=Hypericibacter sp. TaxID=2705401 RepID=UPI003D6D34D6
MKILETRRLILRTLEPDDLDNLFALYRDPEIRRYFPEGTLTREQTREELDWFAGGGDPDHPRLGLWATLHKETGRFIGRCGMLPWSIEGRDEVEVAYLLAKDHWRQGLGAEITRALLRYGFEQLQLTRLIALIDPENQASIRTAERAGLRFERRIVHEGTSCALYAIARPSD